MKKVLVMLALICSLGLVGVQADKAGAATTHDWGWIQGYYGGVHVWMVDTCPDTSFKLGCKEFHHDHYINSTGQFFQQTMYLPEWMWPYYINQGVANAGPATVYWSVLGTPWYGYARDTWFLPVDANCAPPTNTDTCGHSSTGVQLDDRAASQQWWGGNTLHNRYLTVLSNLNLTLNDGWQHGVGRMDLW